MKNSIFFTLFFLFSFSASLFAQKQIGQKIIGEATSDQSGTSVSMPDSKTIAIGAPFNNGISYNTGHVRVYQLSGGLWQQKGGDIDGDAVDDFFGFAVSMPHPNILAVGAFQLHSNNGHYGYVNVYRWNGVNWVQRGQKILGETTNDYSGRTVSMPDSNTIAIGAIGNRGNNGTGYYSGQVRIYKWNGTSWIQKGIDLDAEASGDQFGNSVSMPDSNTVAIGGPYNDGNGSGAGHVRVYKWNGLNWIQKGLDLDGEAAADGFGYAVSMPDTNTVAVGANLNDGNGADAGHVRIFNWNGAGWVQKGLDIDGEIAGDESGRSIDMADSNTVAIGAPLNSRNGIYAGHVRIYRWSGGSWVQDGGDFDGDGLRDFFGTSVCMPDAITFAAGAYEYSLNAYDSGYVKVYAQCNTQNTISVSECRSYLSPSGKYTWTASGTYNDTILNANSCDSLLTINLTILKINTTVSNFTTTLASNQFNAVYQWLDCDSNYAPIAGATNQMFTPARIGNYAVMVTAYGCVDTSACQNISTVGIAENVLSLTQVFPNPSDGAFTVKLGSNNLNVNLKVNSMDGKIIHQEANLNANQLYIDLSKYPKGVYFVTIQNQEAIKVIKLVRR
jgi:hypothetical protein